MNAHYIAFDVHCTFTEVAAGPLTKRVRCGTTIPELREVIEGVRYPRYLTFEEGNRAASRLI